MKTLFLILFTIISFNLFSQPMLIMVSNFQFSAKVGNVSENSFLGSVGFSVDVNQTFIIEFDKKIITTKLGKFKSIDKILSIDTISYNVINIKYNEGSSDPSSKIFISLTINLNQKEKSVKQFYFEKDFNSTTLKIANKYNLVILN